MKDILIDGHRILTTDEVADAVIDYARVLHGAGRTDIVEFPSIHDGEFARCALLLGMGTVAVVEAAVVLPSSFAGSERASEEIARRAAGVR